MHSTEQTEGIFAQLSWFQRDRVDKARVMVVGAGALGNEVLKNLALFGVGHITVVDFDHIEEHNLTRSVLFTHADAEGRRQKAIVVAERLIEMNPAMEVDAICGDIAYDVGLGLLSTMDVVIGCVDNRLARYHINRLCMRAGIPWVDGGIDGLEGTARVFMPGENCYACSLGPEGLKDLAYRMPCAGIVRRNESAGRAATTPIIASIIGAVEVQEALKLIHREQLEAGALTSLCGRMFCYEGQHLTTKFVEFKAYDDDCAVHEQWTPVVTSDITTTTTVAASLQQLRVLLGDDNPQVTLNDCFVDFVEAKDDGKQVEVMKPGRAVAEYLETETPLRGRRSDEVYQHEYSVLDASFPFQELTLAQVGIPQQDILHVVTRQGDNYIAMRGA